MFKWNRLCKIFGHVVYITELKIKGNKVETTFTERCYRKGCGHKMNYKIDRYQVI